MDPGVRLMERVAARDVGAFEALYDGSREVDIKTEVTFEDGRKGVIAARIKVRDIAPVAAPAPPLGKAA